MEIPSLVRVFPPHESVVSAPSSWFQQAIGDGAAAPAMLYELTRKSLA